MPCLRTATQIYILIFVAVEVAPVSARSIAAVAEAFT